MNHGGLGIITSNGKICLPPDLVEQISNGDNSLLFGLYYPKTEKENGYEDLTIKYDVMITPIHPRFWSRSARLLIHLKHKPEAYKFITNFFKENKVSVIHAEGSRSAHRYGTWRLHIAFESLPESLKYDNSQEIYPETYKTLKKFLKDLEENCGDYLFSQKNNYDLNHPVQGWPNSALAHFNNYYLVAKENLKSEENWLFKPFKFKSSDDGVFLTNNSKLINILKYVSEVDKCNLLETIVFAELDTHALNMRIAIIPQEDKKRFFEVGISYERNGNPDSCVGIINCITKSFPKEYNIWRLLNQVKSSSYEGDEGKIVMLIEDLKPKKNSDAYISMADSFLKNIDTSELSKTIKIKNPLISSITHKKISRRIERLINKSTDFNYDVFLSYSEKNKAFAEQIYYKLITENLTCFRSGDYIKGGDEFADNIRKALLNSREMCVLFTRDSIESKWVCTEWGAAWALVKHIVPILLQVKIEELPLRLQSKHAMDFSEIDKYVEQVKERKEDGQLMYFESIYG